MLPYAGDSTSAVELQGSSVPRRDVRPTVEQTIGAGFGQGGQLMPLAPSLQTPHAALYVKCIESLVASRPFG